MAIKWWRHVWWRNNDDGVTYDGDDDGVVIDDVAFMNKHSDEADGDDSSNVVNKDDTGSDFVHSIL